MRALGRSIWQIAATAGAHRVPTAIGSGMTFASVVGLVLGGRFGILAWVSLGLLSFMVAVVLAYHELRLERDRLAAVAGDAEEADRELVTDLGVLVREMDGFFAERRRTTPPAPANEGHFRATRDLYVRRFGTRAFWMADRLLRRGFIDRDRWARIAHPHDHSAMAGFHWLLDIARQTGAVGSDWVRESE